MASTTTVGSRHNTSFKSQLAASHSTSRSIKEPSAEAVLAEANWNDRHHILFSNRIQQNARSYFDRWRDFPDWRLREIAVVSED
eukprot:6331431-Amphidinium_carterae.1